MSSDAGRSLLCRRRGRLRLETGARAADRRRRVDTHAKSLRLGISDEALLQGIMKDPAFQELTGNFNPLALQQALRNMDVSEQGYLASERERNRAPPAAEHSRQDTDRVASLSECPQQLQQ